MTPYVADPRLRGDPERAVRSADRYKPEEWNRSRAKDQNSVGKLAKEI